MADTAQPQDVKNANNAAANNARINNATANNGAANNRFPQVALEARYFTTIPGILKIIEWVFAIIAIACSAPPLISGAHWFLFVVVFCFICTFMWMCVHFFSITNVLRNVPWLLGELAYTGVATILYFVAMIVLFVESNDNKKHLFYRYGTTSRYDSYVAAACFALLNTFVYGVETAWHLKAFLESRRGLSPTSA